MVNLLGIKLKLILGADRNVRFARANLFSAVALATARRGTLQA
jgi:hypothetical protein